MIALDARSAAQSLGGEARGDRVLAPGPGHRKDDRSLSVNFDALAPDGFRVHSFAGDDWRECRDYVKDRLGLRSEVAFTFKPAPPEPTDAQKSAWALSIWSAAAPAAGSPVETYLASRGLRLPSGDAIRWHPACPFTTRKTGAMVALVRNILTDEPQAIHRTALSPEGRKIEIGGHSRLSAGPIAGGAVKLTDDADVTLSLGIGEGIETALSLRTVHDLECLSIWSLVSSSQFRSFPPLSGVETLWVAADHDQAGIKAARAVAQAWMGADREVMIVTPKRPGADLNDIVEVADHG